MGTTAYYKRAANNTVILNGGGESGVATPWWVYSNGTITLSVVTAGVRQGSYAIRVFINGTGTAAQFSQDAWAAVVNGVYRFTFSTRCSTAGISLRWFCIRDNTPYGDFGFGSTPYFTTTTTWQEVPPYVWTSAENQADARLMLTIDGNLTTNQWIEFDQVQMVRIA